MPAMAERIAANDASGRNLTLRSPNGRTIALRFVRTEALAHDWSRESNV
jgi:hypothetical protein